MAAKSDREDIRARGVGKKTKEIVRNIASNIGITESSLIKLHLPAIIQSYDKAFWEKKPD